MRQPSLNPYLRIGLFLSIPLLTAGCDNLPGNPFGDNPDAGSLTVQVTWSAGSVPAEVQSLIFTISGTGANTATHTFEPTKSEIEITNIATGEKAAPAELPPAPSPYAPTIA